MRTCVSGVCGIEPAPAGTRLAAQPKGDCAIQECDGKGGVRDVLDQADFIDDGNPCTVDACSEGVSVNTPKAENAPCQLDKVCTADSRCVECIDGSVCKSKNCTPQNTCADATCSDSTKNNLETDVDCGGIDCSPCANGKACKVPSDCVSQKCTSGSCAASCLDGLQNNGESDVDCGGPNCGKCAVGGKCGSAADCVSGACDGGTKRCVCDGSHLLISELRTRGKGGAADEFVELYNPTAADIKLDASWRIEARSHDAGTYTVKWQGGGLTIPKRGHFLIAGDAFGASPAPDDTLLTGITDGASVVLRNASGVVDAVCFHYSAQSQANLEDTSKGFVCEGEPASNLPHNNGTSGQSNSDVSLERLPGGALGNCVDTKSSLTDFKSTSPAKPQNRFSSPTP